MAPWLKTLMTAESGDGSPPSGACDPRIRDADAQQLAQQCGAMHDELESLEATTPRAPADLGMTSPEQARMLRAQARPLRNRTRTIGRP